MESVNLVEAWQRWAAGESVQHLNLWFWSILWWGRIGKILGIFGLLALIAEIIGPKKLQQFGGSLREIRVQLPELLITPMRKLVSQDPDPTTYGFLTIYILIIATIMGVLCAGSVYLTYYLTQNLSILEATNWGLLKGFHLLSFLESLPRVEGGFLARLLAVSPYGAVGVSAMGSLLFFALVLMYGVPLLIFLLVQLTAMPIDLLAIGLDRRNIGNWIKDATAGFIFLGFVFDLLAS